MSKFLTIGVAGFLVSHTADKVLSQGHEVVGIGNFICGYKDNLPNKVKSYEFNLDDLAKIQSVCKGMDTAVYAACTTYERLSMFSPVLVDQNIIQITITTLSTSISSRLIQRI